GKSVVEKRRVEEVARIVASEGSPGAVGTLQPRRETDNQDSRIRIAEGGDRRVVPCRLARPRLGAKCRQPRTERAGLAGFGRVGLEAIRRNRRHRLRGAPSWWRAAGTAARGGAPRHGARRRAHRARAGQAARKDRGQAWTAIPRDR